ncbi:unnamed protein product [Adineta ricciae]|uniref:Uncharacterized protein n=1 Tax=Adineta ricciae TaxID=249248 RepID=A0A815QS31_ADIRI|nr:unnamed protein product [Adineta ricciae]
MNFLPIEHSHTIPIPSPHQSIPFEKTSPSLFNTFQSLSFPDVPSNNDDYEDVPTLSDEYTTTANAHNEQFQAIKAQFQTYLNDIESNSLSRVIHLLSFYNHFNNEQIQTVLHHIGQTNVNTNDINRLLMNDRRMFVNEQFPNLRTILNEHKKGKD